VSERLAEILDELKRRDGISKVYDFVDYKFPRQAEILADKSRVQAWLFTRRFGKSTTFAKKGAGVCANRHDSKVLFLALTKDSARGILWDAFEKELEREKVPFKPYYNEGIFEVNKSSIFRFFGVDAGYNEMKKVLGQAYDLVGIDESGSMRIDVEALIMHMIYPALIDRQGGLVMLGTAENIPNTFYQKVTDGKHKDLPWSIHKGNTEESPYTGPAFIEEKKRLIALNPDVVKTSWFRTHWLNEWCADDDLLIVKFNPEINTVKELPKGHKFYYGLAVDLGFNDASSFTVDAYSPTLPYIYRLKSFKKRGMDLTDVSNTIKKLCTDFDLMWAIVDGANKQGVEEMNNRHNIPIKLVAADKTDKATFLRLMADDYLQGVVKHVGDDCRDLEVEQGQLMWLKDQAGKEDPRCENHCNDSALYNHRKLKNYFYQPEKSEWKPIQERMEEEFREEGRRLLSAETEESFLY
jgi:hypothetical protein